MASKAGSQPRTPSLVFGTLTVVLLVLLAALAVTTASTAPPAIAEYAPQSIQQIKKPPPNQSSDFGQLGGAPVGKPSAKPTPTPTPTTTPTKTAPRLYDCVGTPPRQIADPQAPPCVASWQGNNGGATSRGVTANEIRVYMPSEVGVGNEYARAIKDLETFFNKRFEFYGRTLNLEPTATGGGSEPSATGTCADIGAQADWVAKQLDVFAAGDDGSDSCWYNALARNQVISLSGQSTELRKDQQSLAPYVWSYPMVGEDLISNVGQFVCSQLAGKKAIYSSNPILKRETRTFGLIVSATLSQVPTPSAPLVAALAACGVHLKTTVVVQAQGSDNGAQNSQETAQWTNASQNAVLKMRTSGVTSVICMCQLQAAAVMSNFASVQGFHPEWIAERSDQNFLAQAWSPTQRNSLLEVSSFPRQISESQTPFEQALNEVDPGFCDCSTSLSFDFGEIGYWQLLLLASGIQMAGPHLTPATFQKALQQTRFPNPASALDEGAVGFANGGHSMENDVTVAWWNQRAQSPVHLDPAGSWCYALEGRRIRPGHWPRKSILPPSLASARCVT
ncbi:MAG TPA: hypothetical protein VHC43_06850 [Mycobacteriales bacterium]|nr:hypothetical protein [Mycobacteriales bacterium]